MCTSPVFKIRQDPRHTKVGRFLAHSGLDELTQLLNIIKGEMSFVGPRPLPLAEAEKVSKKYELRYSVLPGITSSWVVKGSHALTFKEWMENDLEDVKKLRFVARLTIFAQTFLVIAREVYQKMKKHFWVVILFFIFLIGLLIRAYLASQRALWADEVFYFEVSANNSWLNIILTKHWIKDNPPFFMLFLKAWSLISTSIIWLRLTGIISYAVSFLLLFKLFRDSGKKIFLLILSFFALSVYFSYINYWISPYNLILPFSLIQLNLLKNLFLGNIKKRKFIILFTLFNFLLINTHYGSLYLFLGYIVFLVYSFIYKKAVFMTLFEACLLSFISFLPTLYHIYQLREEIYRFQQQDMGGLTYGSLLGTINYVLDHSLFRLHRAQLTTKILALIAAALLLGLTAIKKTVPKYYLLFFTSLFVGSSIFLYAAGRHLPSIMGERPWWTFHLGFYFAVAILFSILIKFNRILASLFIMLFGLMAVQALVTEIPANGRYIFPGQVSVDHFSKFDYDRFITYLAEKNLADYDSVVYWGNDMRNNHVKFVFLRYYLAYDSKLAEFRAKELIAPESLPEFTKKVASGKNILVINFERSATRTSLLSSKLPKMSKAEIINFWFFVKRGIAPKI